MSNLSKSDRQLLDENFFIATVYVHKKFVSKIDGTVILSDIIFLLEYILSWFFKTNWRIKPYKVVIYFLSLNKLILADWSLYSL